MPYRKYFTQGIEYTIYRLIVDYFVYNVSFAVQNETHAISKLILIAVIILLFKVSTK